MLQVTYSYLSVIRKGHHLWENLYMFRIIKTMCTVPCVGLFWLLFHCHCCSCCFARSYCSAHIDVWMSLSGDNCNVKEAEIGFLFRIFWMKWRRSWQNLKRSSLMVMHTSIMHTWLHINYKYSDFHTLNPAALGSKIFYFVSCDFNPMLPL